MTDQSASVVTATSDSYFLAEGPLWDPIRERVWWVDVLEGQVHCAKLQPDGTLHLESTLQAPDTAGALALAADGKILVAGRHRVWMRDAEGEFLPGPRLLPEGSSRMLNDGAVDPFGRFVVGSLDQNEERGVDSLQRIEANGELTCIDADLSLSNGLDWSVDGSTFYSVDTLTGRVFRRRYGPSDMSSREVFVSIADGYPDGLCVDADDHVWVAIWGTGEVRRFDPQGKHVHTISVPAPHASSVAFIGVELETMLITTAREDLDPEQLAGFPDSGRLFTVDCGVRGKVSRLWGGFAPSVLR